MAEVAALGLASNVCQFVEQGFKLIRFATHIYASGFDTTAENAECEAVEKDFRRNRDEIRQSLPNCPASESLTQLCRACDDVAQDLLKELDKLKVPNKGKHRNGRRFARCLWTGVRGAWGHDYIVNQKRRLNDLRDQLQFHLIVDLRSVICDSLAQTL